MFTIRWADHVRDVVSVGDVDALLDALQSELVERPELVTVERAPGGESLAIGIGGDRSVLSHVGPDGDPPYWVGIGGEAGEEDLCFRFGGSLSEFPSKMSIPIAAARAAMRKFCETGELARDIAWEEA